MSRSGGTEKCTAILANELSKLSTEYKVFVIDISNPDEKTFFELDDNICIYHFHVMEYLIQQRKFIRF